jgi:hypothetical protein
MTGELRHSRAVFEYLQRCAAMPQRVRSIGLLDRIFLRN